MESHDVSGHSLNTSTSKHRYSFSRDQRFQYLEKKPIVDVFYDLPTTRSKRTTTQGFGNKTMGPQDKSKSPPVGAYDVFAEIHDPGEKIRMKSFGTCRQKMMIGGPFGHIKYQQKLPAPGAYEIKNATEQRVPSLKSRVVDHYLEKVAKLPGPGAYKAEDFGTNSYYISSKYRNFTNGKFSQLKRSLPMSLQKGVLGPGQYDVIDGLNKTGRYHLSKHNNAGSCVFSRSERQGLAEKTKAFVPGPGQYRSFSGFN